MRQVARTPLFVIALLGFGWAVVGIAQTLRPGPAGSGTRLHNGWRVTPAGQQIKTSDMLVGCSTSPDGKTITMVAAGAGAHTVYLLDAATGALRQSIPVKQAWDGAAWSPDSTTLYVSGGVSGTVHVLRTAADGTMQPSEPIVIIPPQPTRRAAAELPWISGLAVSKDGKSLYVAGTGTDTVYRVDLDQRKVAVARELNDGARPYRVRLSADGATLYVTQWAASSVATLDPATLEPGKTIGVGRHPNDLLELGERLFVSCGNDDAVVAVNAAKDQVTEWIVTRLTPRSPAGSTPNALAVSPDSRTLYVANADNNCVAVVDISEPGRSRVRGFIPTGSYPTSVAVSSDGSRLFIGSGKGLGTGPNAQITGAIDPVAPKGYPYIVTLLSGLITHMPVPTDGQLAAFSRQVLSNTPYGDEVLARPRTAPAAGTNPIPSRVGDASPIKHVLYIIKENRTYDQVFGDLKDASGRPMGEGDPRLTLFGEDVAPNHRALARDFVVLDNLYCDGEVSVDGHHWSNGAYVPDFMQRTWVQQYSGRGRPPLNEDLAATPNGRIWDVCERHGVDYRTYYYHTRKRMSPEWAAARAAGRRDYDYVDIFIRDFQQMERDGTMPRFMVMALSEDHTRGTTPGAFTPKASVASNDLGLGKIVAAISRSRYWKEFAIFVIEDDAQNGPDHIDAHRTVGLVISPFTRKQGVDSTFYTTSAFLRTMELILGLPPMSQFDAAATPLYNAFSMTADTRPYDALQPKVDMEAKNPAQAYGAQRSARIDFSEPDRLTLADEDALNRALWHSIKGADTPYPGVRRRALW